MTRNLTALDWAVGIAIFLACIGLICAAMIGCVL